MTTSTPLVGIPRHDAVAAKAGFQYQDIATALAWIRLTPNEVLQIETAEDFATQEADSAVITQVKRVKKPLTLSVALPFLNSVVRHIQNHPNKALSFVYHTTAKVASERPPIFGDGEKGIDVWNSVKKGGNAARLVQALRDLAAPGSPLFEFLAQSDQGTIESKLINSVHWAFDATSADDIRYEAQEEFVRRVQAETGADAMEARQAFPALIERIADVSVRKDPADRVLRHGDLNELIQQSMGKFLLYGEHERLQSAADVASSVDPAYFEDKILNRTQRLKKTRFFVEEADLIKEAIALSRDVRQGGALHAGPPSARAAALNWSARVLLDRAPDEAAAAIAEGRELAQDELSTIVSALHLGKSDVAAAKKSLQGHDEPEAMTVRYHLERKSSVGSALAWVKRNSLAPEHFDEDGRFFVLDDLLQANAWEEIEQWISLLPPLSGDCPALGWSVAFGLVGLSATPNTRNFALHAVPMFDQVVLRDTGEALARRSRASKEFRVFANWAARNGLSVGASGSSWTAGGGLSARATDALKYALWLDLQDPIKAIGARAEIESHQESEPESFEWVALAVSAGLDLDAPVLISKLARHIDVYGSLTQAKSEALLALLMSSDPAIWLDQWDTFNQELSNHFLEASLAELAVRAFVAIGRADDARAWVQGHLAEEQASRERLLDWIEAKSGGNEVADLERRVKEDPSDGTRRELLIALINARQLPRALALGRALFEESQSYRDAEAFVRVLALDGRWEEIVSLLGDAALTAQSGFLQVALRVALFNLGQWAKVLDMAHAHGVVGRELEDLEKRVAIYSGDWDELGVWLERARTDTDASADALLQWAHIAVVLGKITLSKVLTRRALQLPGASPERWIQGYSLAVRGNWEDDQEVSGWLQLATSSASEDGPIQQRSLQELVDLAPSWREKTERVASETAAGNLFQAIASRMLNRPISNFYSALAEHNRRERDPGQRIGIPAFAGVRREGILRGIGRVALDTTALLTLAELDMLDATLEAFEKVALPHGLGAWIFKERERTPHHQPSKVSDARKLVSGFSRAKIKVLTREPEYSRSLSAEVGDEIPKLIASARASGLGEGEWFVIQTAPVYRPNSLGEEEADVKTCAQNLRSLHCVVDSLLKHGAIDKKEHQHAQGYLAHVDRGWGEEDSIPPGKSLLLTELALNYLEHLNLVDSCVRGGYSLWVDQAVQEEAHAYEAVDDVSQVVLARLDRIRQFLMLSGSNNKVVALARPPMPRSIKGQDGDTPPDPDSEANADGESVVLLQEIFASLDAVDAVVMDDRAGNRHLVMTDTKKRDVVVASTLDVLDALSERGIITIDDWLSARQKLRQAGYLFIPFSLDELVAAARSSNIEDGVLRESASARAIRENHQMAQFSLLLQQPMETSLLANNNRAIRDAIVKLWSEDKDTSLIAAQCAWLLDLARLDGFGPSLPNLVDANRWNHIDAMVLWQLLVPLALPEDRKEAFAQWLNSEYLEDMQKQRTLTFKVLVDLVKQQVLSIPQVLADKETSVPEEVLPLLTKKMMAEAVSDLPESVRNAVMADVSFLERASIERIRSVSLHLDDRPAIEVQSLYDAAARCLDDGSPQMIGDSTGRSWKLTKNDADEVWGKEEGGKRIFQVRHAQLLSGDRARRERYIRAAYREHGVPIEEIPFDVLSSSTVEALDAFELDIGDTSHSFSERMQLRLEGGSVHGSELVPRSRLYFERLIGSRNGSRTLAEFGEARRLRLSSRTGLDCLEDDLLVSAHSSLVPIQTITSAPVAALKEWLGAKLGTLDLWSLTGLLEGLLAREDVLAELSQEAVHGGRLLGEFANPTNERIALQAAMIAHIDGTISAGQFLVGEPPFWRRAASIAQSAVVERVLLRSGVPLSSFAEWAKQAWPRFQATTLCDLVAEPRWHGYLLQPGQVAQELIGRVMNVANPRRQAWEGTPLGQAFFETDDSLESKWSIGFAALPGPLEGALGCASPLPDSLFIDTKNLLANAGMPLHERLLVAAHTVGLGTVPGALADEIAAGLRKLDANPVDLEDGLMQQLVMALAMASSDCRHADLAKAVEDFLIHRPKLPLALRLHVGLTACGAFADESLWISAVVSLAGRLLAQGVDRDGAAHMLFVLTAMCEAKWSLRAPLGAILARLRASANRL